MNKDHKQWFCSDHHFNHRNIIKFTCDDNKRIRPFESVEEHDETIINNHNDLVQDKDRVYFMGDVCINRNGLSNVSKMKGKKVLVKGNHDIYKLKDYTEHFQDIRAYKMLPKHGIIVSHIPVLLEPRDGDRFQFNVHGHTHINIVRNPRYINMCLEHTNFKPLELNEILSIIEERKYIIENVDPSSEKYDVLWKRNWKI